MVLTGLATVPFIALTRADRPASAQTGLETVSVKTPSGRTVSGVVAVPATVPAPALLLIHGSTGLTDVFKSFALDFARDGFFAVALDLFDGRVANDDAAADLLKREVRTNPERAAETTSAWLAWLKADSRSNGKFGVVGRSFGAGWALETSITTPVDATVLYVGLSLPGAKRLALLKGPVMVHLAERDFDPALAISKSVAKQFEDMMNEAGKSVEVHWYQGDHFFSYSTFPTYDKEQADLARGRTVKFLRANLR
jgi:carboxymethylenebutenolidase